MSIKPERVFVLGIDGAMGSAVRDGKTPNIDALVVDGTVSYSAQAVLPSASYQNWGALLHGVGAEKHGIDGGNPISEDVPWPSCLKVLQKTYPHMTCALFSCWNPINQHIIEKSIEAHRVSLPDPELAVSAADYIRQHVPDLFFMQFDLVDAAGHAHGYGSEKYFEQIEINDSEIGQVIDAIKDAGVYQDSLIMIISDHGGIGTGHGGDEPECLDIFWSARGPGIAQGVELGSQISIKDTPAIILYTFGVPIPDGYDSVITEEIFAKELF